MPPLNVLLYEDQQEYNWLGCPLNEGQYGAGVRYHCEKNYKVLTCIRFLIWIILYDFQIRLIYGAMVFHLS